MFFFSLAIKRCKGKSNVQNSSFLICKLFYPFIDLLPSCFLFTFSDMRMRTLRFHIKARIRTSLFFLKGRK